MRSSCDRKTWRVSCQMDVWPQIVFLLRLKWTLNEMLKLNLNTYYKSIYYYIS